jgi:thioredoxin
LLLVSCDRIDVVGDKKDDLNGTRETGAVGTDGMDLKWLTEGSSKDGPAVQDLPETEFDSFIAEPGRLNIVDFHAEWCGPCKRLAPVLTGLVEENSSIVRLGKINVDQAKELAREEGVTGIPDVRFYVDGKLVHKFTGAPPKEHIEELIATHAASISRLQDPADTARDGSGAPAAVVPSTRPPKAKPLEEAVKPMEKNWLPPGVSPKR